MSRRAGLRRLGFPLTILISGVLATTLAAVEMRRDAAAQDQERFDAVVDRLQDSITDRLNLYIAMLRAGAGLFAASDIQSPQQFRAFVERLRLSSLYPGVQGIGYSARFAPQDLASVVQAQRAGGRPDFRVWPDAPRVEYHSILFLEPLDRRNEAAIGYDMFTAPVRRAAMERARDSGGPAASGLVTLVQEIDELKQPGFLIYMPVYEGGIVPPTVDERRRRLRGFIYSPFRAGDLFNGILGRNARPPAGFALFDGDPNPASLIHQTATPPAAGALSATRRFEVAGRAWTAQIYPAPAFYLEFNRRLVPVVAWSGMTITLVLTGLAVLQTRARERAEQSEASLREQTATLEAVNQTGAQLAAELDLDRLVQALTDAGTRLTRAQFGAFFYNQTNEQGESYTLYTLSGVAREAFHGFPMPRNTAVFGPTFRGDAIVRAADITADSRYGHNPPYHGLPKGHLPVRSYLAVPVKSRSGEVLGGLFFGHPQPGVFTEQAERIIAGIAAQAAIAIDNARLYRQVQDLLGAERSARSEAERASRLKDEFLATLSHELRTPLNAILGWAHMASTGTLSEAKRQGALETILRNARAQSQLIEDLLDMSRIISGRVRLYTSLVRVLDVVEAAMQAIRPTAPHHRIEVTAAPAASTLVVLGDHDRLQQVLWNLLTNAIKFTPPEGRIEVSIAGRGGEVEIAVTDTGIGISTDFLPHVFERFRQADGSVSREHGGLGLGLSIAQHLVEMHGGSIHASSPGPGRGATFTVRLPAAAPGLRTGGPRETPMRRADAAALRSVRILVVDDDADAGELAKEILTQRGAEVTLAGSARDALRWLRANAGGVDIVVSDLGMPQMDGFEFMRQVRALPPDQGGAVGAIALTAYAGTEDQARALAAGYDCHLAKPFTPDVLVNQCAALARSGAV